MKEAMILNLIYIYLIIFNYDSIKANEIESDPYVYFKISTANKVYGNSNELSYYYTNLHIGNSKKKQSYMLVTSRTITSSPCEGYCPKCGKHENGYYKLESENDILSCNSILCNISDSSCLNDKCTYSTTYRDGSSLKGMFVKEKFRFNEYDDLPKISVPLGCTTEETKNIYNRKVDGILGLGNSDKNFVSQLKRLNVIKKNVFSLCFAQEGGIFKVDEINDRKHLENPSFFPLKNNEHYLIDVTAIKIGYDTLNIKVDNKLKYESIIDSGTTLTYLPKEVYDFIVNKIADICKDNNDRCGVFEYSEELGPCYKLDNEEQMNYALNHFWPNITYVISDEYSYTLKPYDYAFENHIKEGSMMCLGINKRHSSVLTLGTTWMHSHDIIFDRENKRIGFAYANCSISDEEIFKKAQEKFFNEEEQLYIKKQLAKSQFELDYDRTIFEINERRKKIIQLKNTKKIKNSKNQSLIEENKKYSHILYTKIALLLLLFAIFVMIIIFVICCYKKSKQGESFCFFKQNNYYIHTKENSDEDISKLVKNSKNDLTLTESKIKSDDE